MASTVRSERPKLRRARSTTSSLAGMEKPYTPKEISPFEIYQDPVDLYLDPAQLDKPLPPTPRKPSSVYSVQREEEQQAHPRTLRNDVLPSSTFLAPTTYRSSTSRLPDPTPARPQLIRQAQTHAASDPVIRPSRGKDEKPHSAARVSKLQRELSFDSLSISGMQSLPNKNVASVEADSAAEHADSYTSVLHTSSSALPTSTAERYYVNHQRAPSPLSGRITDVVDQSLIPAPLQFNSFEESERPPSRFSSSSSEVEIHHIRNSLRGMARKAFHLRKESKGTDDTDWAAFTRFQEKASLTPRRQSRIGSFVGQRRESFQQSISGMYDTLTALSTPTRAPKPTPVTTNGPSKPHRPRVKSPAIPLSPYQEMGPKAWETASKSSKKTTKSSKARLEGASLVSFSLQDEQSRIRFSIPTYGAPSSHEKEQKHRSVATKLASAFSSGAVQVESAVGLNTVRVKRTRSEKKREELKRKIKVIGLGEPTSNKAGGQWL
ncbi:MAG: hypothetical protein LQ343_006657 [Gyalolechia ehrenbergii]|nr:MAG: hypothetical protein LQ343_006657 [Gyalolechia ehrenbergii]